MFLRSVSRIKSIVAILLSVLMASPVFAQTPEIKAPSSGGWLYGVTKNYRPRTVPQISWEDSPRIERLMRAGRIYLSLRDAIALALENNLDLESARINPKLSDANLLRANAGALLRNVSNSISSGASSASLGVLAGANSLRSTGGGGGGSSQRRVAARLNRA